MSRQRYVGQVKKGVEKTGRRRDIHMACVYVIGQKVIYVYDVCDMYALLHSSVVYAPANPESGGG
jgi:hypothetical protein